MQTESGEGEIVVVVDGDLEYNGAKAGNEAQGLVVKILLTPENVGRKTMEANRKAKSGGKSCVFVVLSVLVGILAVANVVSADYVNRVYWTKFAPSDDGVLRANADGSGIEQIVSVAFNSLDGLAIDPVENKLYIGTSYHLLRCNLDGSGLETVISGGNAFDFFCLEIDTANRKIYWSDWIQGGPTPRMRRADLDGTSIETVFEGTISYGKAIDAAAGKLYWVAGSIYKSDLDGSNRVTVLANTFGRGHLHGLALDIQSNKMYFTTWEGGGIWRANMDGTDVEHLSDDKTTAIAVDSDGGKLYWTSWAYGADEIKRANLDGSGEEVVCLMGGSGNAIALEFIPEPTEYYVDADANGGNDGSSWADAFNYLQDALATASSGDEIWVAEGVYTPDSNSAYPNGTGERKATFQLINGVAVRGGYAGFGEPNPNARDIDLYETILSGDLEGDDGPDFVNNGENSYHVVTGSNTVETAILDGFVITGGNADGSYSYLLGGGMYNSSGSPTVTNCILRDNESSYSGGGMFNNIHSKPMLIGCMFSGNRANGIDGVGGGIFNLNFSSPTVALCTFTANSAGLDGGGIHNDNGCEPNLINCKFSGNSARRGGALCNDWESTAVLVNCTFSRNSATIGGAIYNTRSDPNLSSCIFTGNSAQGGGGVSNWDSNPTLTNCTFSGNLATGTGEYEGGGGMRNAYNSNPRLSNCIFWGNTATRGPEITLYSSLRPSTLVFAYSNVRGGEEAAYVDDGCKLNWGEGNIDSDPCFVEAGYWADACDPNIIVEPNNPNVVWVDGDYRLRRGSPCIDSGDPNYAAEPNEMDLDGNPRVVDGRIDMGAYEYQGGCVPPAEPGGPEPADGAIDVPVDAPLLWNGKLGIAEKSLASCAIDSAGVLIDVKKAAKAITAEGAVLGEGELDVTTGAAVKAVGHASLSAIGMSASGGSILWDLTHGVYIDYRPSGDFSSLVSVLGSAGYSVSTTSAGVDHVDLSAYDVLVVCLGSAWDSSYTAFEVSAIETFVNNGGGLLILGDNSNCPNGNVNPVAQVFGVTCGASSQYTGYFSSWSSHPIFTDCSQVYYGTGGEISAVPPGELVAWTSTGHGTVAVASGSGRVVVTGDINFCANRNLSKYDNQLFAENIFDWLSSGNGGCATSYDVYFGTDVNTLELIQEDLCELRCEPGLLEACTTYYWQVAAKNDCGETYGDIWSFTTELCNAAPVACVVGGDRVVEAGEDCEARVVLDGSCSSDADSTVGTNDDINDFDWYEVIDACEPNSDIYLGSGEVIECNLGLGEHLIILEVADKAGAFDSNEVVITVEDAAAPVITLNGADMVVLECGADSYVEEGATATDNCEDDVAVAIGGDVVDTSACGTYVITYDATDSWGNEAEQVVRTVVVEDTEPPEFSLVVEPNVLWPPNHKMVKIAASWEVSDNCDESPGVSLVSVTSSEDDDSRGDGHTSKDIRIGDDGSIYLRAERSGKGPCRVYTITYKAVDDSGNVTEASATVRVPHRKGPVKRRGKSFSDLGGRLWRLLYRGGGQGR
ncbi:MAG: DUF5011 domain-containing protein [Planctomycetota bacterium]|nr:MAG: DUF5011 domain-containing protein [Planctomycetota bacterium]